MTFSARVRFLALMASFIAGIVYQPAASYAFDDYIQLKGAVHLDTVISGGEMAAQEILKLANGKGLGVAIITDHDLMKWEYGLFPLRRLIKKKVQRGSILQFGAQRYIDEVEMAASRFPGMVVLHGAEAIPFYYWQGDVRDRNLTLRNGGVHLLVLGLNSALDYEGLPSIGNGYPRRYGLSMMARSWPVGLLVLGFLLIRVKRTRSVKFGGLRYRQSYRPYKLFGIPLFALGAIFSFNNFPFAPPRFDQYHGDQGAAPYQITIDYVNGKGGMVFWAHPEAKMSRDLNGVKTLTDPYHEMLLKSKNYTGFAVFAEGMKYILPPGGIWDRVLLEYTKGLRERPAWAIGEVDLKLKGAPIDSTLTVFLLKEKSRRAALEALRTGKLYAIDGPDTSSLALKRFAISDESGARKAYMGDWIEVRGAPQIEIEVQASSAKPDQNAFVIDLIRNGEVIKSFKEKDFASITFGDLLDAGFSKGFYRLDIKGRKARIASNPIFVRQIR